MASNQPKPADKRVRRNRPKDLDPQLVALNTEDVPEPPSEIPGHLQEQWIDLWSSDLAAIFTASDLPAMRRLFRLYAEEIAFDAEGMRSPVSEGSTRQKQIHPLVKQAATIRNEILSLEDRFGLNPQSRLKLGISLGEAQKSLKDMNERLLNQARTGGQELERPDPRLTAIDTTAG